MRAALHVGVRRGRIFERNTRSTIGRSLPASMSGQTCCINATLSPALYAIGCGRSIDPVTMSRFIITPRMSIVSARAALKWQSRHETSVWRSASSYAA